MKAVALTFGKDADKNYLDTVKAAGAEPLVLQSTAPSAEWRTAFSRCDALLLAGGGDVQPERYGLELSPSERSQFIRGEDAARDEMELELARKAVLAGMPVLAICRGIQLLNVALGGTLIHDVPAYVGTEVRHAPAGEKYLAHQAQWESESRFVTALGRSYPIVNSSHHQALGRVAQGLVVIARAPDGVIEAVEDPASKFLVGVQFHPERMWKDNAEFLEMFRLFVESA